MVRIGWSINKKQTNTLAIGPNGYLVACADLNNHIYKVSFLLESYLIEPKSKKKNKHI